jgi:hypothetical protein
MASICTDSNPVLVDYSSGLISWTSSREYINVLNDHKFILVFYCPTMSQLLQIVIRSSLVEDQSNGCTLN